MVTYTHTKMFSSPHSRFTVVFSHYIALATGRCSVIILTNSSVFIFFSCEQQPNSHSHFTSLARANSYVHAPCPMRVHLIFFCCFFSPLFSPYYCRTFIKMCSSFRLVIILECNPHPFFLSPFLIYVCVSVQIEFSCPVSVVCSFQITIVTPPKRIAPTQR